MALNSILGGIIVARWLGAEGLGTISALSVAISTTVLLSGLGIPTANTYIIGRDRSRVATALLNSLVFSLISGGAFALGLWALAFVRPGILPDIPSTLVALAIVSVPFHLATAFGTNIFLAVGRVREYSLLDLFSQSFTLINAVIALMLVGGGIWMLVGLNSAAAFATAIVIVVMLFRYLRQLGPEVAGAWKLSSAQFIETLRLGLKGQILFVAMMLVLRGDLLIVAHFRGAAETGIYAVATQVTLFLLVLPTVVSQLLMAKVAAADDDSVQFTSRASRYTAFIMFIACLAAVPISLALPLAYGPQFAEAPEIVWLLLPGTFFMALQTILVQYFVGAGLRIQVPLMWVFVLGLNVTLNWLFILDYGLRGAAVVSSISYFLAFALIFAYFRRKHEVALRDVLIMRGSEFMGLLRLKFK